MKKEVNSVVTDPSVDNVPKLVASLDKLNTKNSKFLFNAPESQTPSPSLYEIYFHATVVKNMGYKTYILVEHFIRIRSHKI
jgi:hypothetical protein